MILALEFSTRISSWALQDESGRIRQAELELDRFRAEDVLPALEAFLDEQLPDSSRLSEIRVGRGPGNFSGVRLALSWAIGWAAAGELRLRAVSSGVAWAHRLEAENESCFAILGDARRGQLWGACWPEARVDFNWELLPPEAWPERIQGRPVYSAEAERLPETLKAQRGGPHARDLFPLPDSALQDPLEPLYLHPAVAPKP